MAETPGVFARFKRLALKVSKLASDIGTATATSTSVTLNSGCGTVTTASLTTAQNGIYTLTINNDQIDSASDHVYVELQNGTNTQGTPIKGLVTVSAGSVAVQIINKHASAEALNGSILVRFFVVKAD